MARHFLVPIDGSELTAPAVSAVLDLAAASQAKLTFLHVQPSYYGNPGAAVYGECLVLDPQVNRAFSEATARLARTVLDQALAPAKERGVSATAETCVSPLVHEAIVQAAERCQCDLIAMASHSRKGLPGVLLGSETQRVLSHSTVPVLVIPARSLGA